MARSRKFFTVGALGVASFALIGAGATATFTDAVNGSQAIHSGVMNMTVRGDGADSAGKVVTWTTPVTPVGSTFTSGRHVVTIKNEGTIPVNKITLTQNVVGTGSSAARDDALYRGIWVTIDTNGAAPALNYTGPLSGMPTMEVVNATIPVGYAFDTEVTYYAGSGRAPTLVNAAQDAAISANWKISFEG